MEKSKKHCDKFLSRHHIFAPFGCFAFYISVGGLTSARPEGLSNPSWRRDGGFISFYLVQCEKRFIRRHFPLPRLLSFARKRLNRFEQLFMCALFLERRRTDTRAACLCDRSAQFYHEFNAFLMSLYFYRLENFCWMVLLAGQGEGKQQQPERKNAIRADKYVYWWGVELLLRAGK